MKSSKVCTKCGLEKLVGEFHKRTGKLRHPRCKSCRAEDRAEYYANNKARELEVNAEWRANNPEYHPAYRALNLDECRARVRDWHDRHPERRQESVRRYQARKMGATVEEVDYAVILRRDGSICHICSTEVDSGALHFDHVIPLSRGGSHSMDNIKVSHAFCNMSKGDKIAEVQ